MASPLDWIDNITKRLRRGRRPNQAPARDTMQFPNFFPLGQQTTRQRIVYKPTPRNLRYFAKTPYARKAINAIKNPIKELKWEVSPLEGIKLNSELKRQIEIASRCFSQPNNDDNISSFLEQITEDICVGAGAFETQQSGDENRPLWMWPVDGLTIQIFPGWTGDPSEARFAQSVGYGSYAGGGQMILLRDDELVYLRPNPNPSTPFGLGELEVAFMSIARQLGLAEFQGNLTSNARPSIFVNLGEVADKTVLEAFRSYWINDIEGQGKTPIAGMKGGKIERLYPEGDNGLFLKYADWIVREIAAAFDLSPQNMGLERDINRNTSETAEDRDWTQAIKPRARMIAGAMTTQVVQRRLGFSQLQFRFVDLDREDENAAAERHKLYFEMNALTPNEIRRRIGEEPSDNEFADMTNADIQIAIAAARGAKEVLDDDIGGGGKKQPAPAAKKPAKGKRQSSED
ncbi:MAG: phage portal protein [Alphaproteobacteria bacterium]|nr:phage portal protein [Alphaproteobacteria bacterium]